MKCPFCGEEITKDQPKVAEDGEWLHIGCAIKLDDNSIIDADHGDN